MISLNCNPLTLLTSSYNYYIAHSIDIANPVLSVCGTLPDGCLIIRVQRDTVGGMHEDIDITNHFLLLGYYLPGYCYGYLIQ